jgi:RHS repeat-associated protein
MGRQRGFWQRLTDSVGNNAERGTRDRNRARHLTIEPLEGRALLAPFWMNPSVGQYPFDYPIDVSEGDSFQIYLIRGNESYASTVSWAADDAPDPWGATLGDDYSIADEGNNPEGSSGTEEVGIDACGAVLNVSIAEDDLPEFDEYFTISITDADPDGVGGPSSVTFRIPGDLGTSLSDPFAITTCNCSCKCGGDFSYGDPHPEGNFANIASLSPSAPPTDTRPADATPGMMWVASDNPHPIVAQDASFGSTVTSADTIEAKLYFADLTPVSIYYDASSAVASTNYRFALQVNGSSLATGQYSWVLDIIEHHTDPDDDHRQRFLGSTYVVNRMESEFGNRWALSGIDQLFVQDNGALLVHGDGNVLWFPDNGSTYGAADGDTSGQTLTEVSGAYYLTDKWGNYQQFNSSGQLTSRTTREGITSTYNYTSDKLTSITDSLGHGLTLAYTSDLLSSATDEQGHITTLGRDLVGRLTSITLPDPDDTGPLDAPVTTFTYDSTTSLMTSATNANDETTTFTYGIDRSLASVTFDDSTTRIFDPYLTAGVIDPAGSNGTLSSPADLLLTSDVWGRVTDENNHTTYYRTDRFGQYTEVKDAFGNITTYTRDSMGQVTERVDPDPDGAGLESSASTTYTYSGTNLTQISYPDGSYETWTYNTTLNKPIEHVDRRGSVTKYTLNSTTGLVTSMRQVIGLVDGVFNSETDDLVTDYTYTTGGTGLPPAGLIATETDPLGRVTTYGYDVSGNLTSITYADGTADEATVEMAYTNGLLTTSTDELGKDTTYAYDDLNQLTTVTLPDPDNGGSLTSPVWTYEYNTWHKVSRQVDPLGRETLYEYNSRGDLTSERKVVGEVDDEINEETDDIVTLYDYDDARNLTSQTDPLGRVTTYAYDAMNRRTSMTLPDPDGVGGVTSSVWSWTYDAWGRMLSETDPLSIVTYFTPSTVYRTLSTTVPDSDGAGPDTAYTKTTVFDALGNVTSQSTELTSGVTNTYDAWGRLTRVTQADPDGEGSLTAPYTDYEYDKVGNLRYVTGPMGKVTEYQYDNRNRLIKVIGADPDAGGSLTSPETDYTYDDAGRLLTVTDPLDRVTTYTYDNLGRKLTETLPDPDGGGSLTSPVITYAYDAANRVTSVTDALGAVTEYTYNALDSVTKVKQRNAGNTLYVETLYDYDDAGQLLSVTDTMGNVTSYTYDNMGRTLTVTQPDPDGGGGASAPVTTYTYDKLSNVLTVTDPLSHITTYEYDKRYRKISVTEPDPDEGGSATSPVTEYTYDGDSNLLTLEDPSGNTTTWVYDLLNRVTSETNALSDTRSFEYDAAGHLTKKTDRLARVIEYAYDGLGRQTSEVWKTGGSTVRTIGYTYDAASQLTEVSDPSADYDYTYDNLGRVTSEMQDLAVLTANLTYASTFDKNNNRLTLTSTIGSTADFKNDYTYDYLNRPTALSQQGQSGGNTVAEKLVQFVYNAAGQFTQLKRWEDVTGATKHAGTTNFGYDNIGRVTKITHHDQVTGLASGTNWGTGILAGYQYTWDPASRITGINNYVDGSVSYSYDNTDQLTAADNPSPIGDESYSYDANGNRTMSGYSTGTNNQTSSDGTYNYTYDDEGNRLTKTNISTSAKEEYTWDHRNRLTKVTYKNSSNVVTATVEYQYDYQNRMAVRTEDTDGPGSNVATDQVFSYLGQGINPHLEFDGTGGSDVSARNVWGPNVDQILAVEKVTTTGSAGNVAWAYGDHLGTPRDLADYNSGTDTVSVANHRVIDGFGRLTSQTNSGFTIPQQFTGKPFDPTTGYGYYLNRSYDPTTGKWLSEDPISFEGGDVNVGRYVSNSPINSTDPTGTTRKTPLQKVHHEKTIGTAAGIWYIKMDYLQVQKLLAGAPNEVSAPGLFLHGTELPISIEFTPSKTSCATDVSFIQIVKITQINKTSKKREIIDDLPFKPGDDNNGKGGRRYPKGYLTPDGWGVDDGLLPGKSPLYRGVIGNGRMEDEPGLGGPFLPSDPHFQDGTHFEFETFAVSRSASGAYVVLGGIKWGFTIKKYSYLTTSNTIATDYGMILDDFAPIGGNSANLRDAIAGYNSVVGDNATLIMCNGLAY